jgi:hypothetical protein
LLTQPLFHVRVLLFQVVHKLQIFAIVHIIFYLVRDALYTASPVTTDRANVCRDIVQGKEGEAEEAGAEEMDCKAYNRELWSWMLFFLVFFKGPVHVYFMLILLLYYTINMASLLINENMS